MVTSLIADVHVMVVNIKISKRITVKQKSEKSPLSAILMSKFGPSNVSTMPELYIAQKTKLRMEQSKTLITWQVEHHTWLQMGYLHDFVLLMVVGWHTQFLHTSFHASSHDGDRQS